VTSASAISTAQTDHAAKLSAVREAEAALEAAAQAKRTAHSKTIEVDSTGLDQAITAAAAADAKVEVLQRRLAVARDRLLVAEEVLRAAELADLEAAAAAALVALRVAEDVLVARVNDLVSQLSDAWTEARVFLRAADNARGAVATAKGEPDSPVGGKVAAFQHVMDGRLDVLASTVNLKRYIDAAPQREAEEKQRQEMKAASEVRAALDGQRGLEAQTAALSQVREALATDRTMGLPTGCSASDSYARTAIATRSLSPANSEV
jgi:hypothetical protein